MIPFDEMHSFLADLVPPKTLLVCIGNSLKGDDGAGPAIHDKVRGKLRAGLFNAGMAPENSIQKIITAASETIILVDAADFGESPGCAGIFAIQKVPRVAFSTHVLSPTFFTKMITDQCDAAVYLLGIQPGQTELGRPISPQVERAVEQIADMLIHCFK